MTYRFIYSKADAGRLIQSVLIDGRVSVPEILNKNGNEIKTFIDSQIAMVTDNTLFYKLETDKGSLAGYFSLQVVREGVVVILQKELRIAFQQFDVQITGLISSFITSNAWKNDSL